MKRTLVLTKDNSDYLLTLKDDVNATVHIRKNVINGEDIYNAFYKKLLFCKWVVIIRLFTMFRAHCIPISHFFWR